MCLRFDAWVLRAKLMTVVGLCTTLAIAACGGGGGGDGGESHPAGTLVLPDALAPWFHGLQAEGGNETLVLSTLDELNLRNLSAATPMYMIKGGASGVEDVTSTYFDQPPTTFWARNIVFFKDANGNDALWICSQGRETTNPTSLNGTNGVWAEQDQLFVKAGGKYVNKTESLPQVIDFSHGCAIARQDTHLYLVKNALNGTAGWTAKPLLEYNPVSDTYETAVDAQTAYLSGGMPANVGVFAAEALSSSTLGQDDIVYGNTVIPHSGAAYQLGQPSFYADGYRLVHNLLAADLDGDGMKELIATYSKDDPSQFLAGAKIAIYKTDPVTMRLVYQPDAIPAALGDSEMGLTIRTIDANFDGKEDIVTSGRRYTVGASDPTDNKVRVALINNGDGTFSRRTIGDEAALEAPCSTQCRTEVYYLKNADGTFNLIAYGRNGSGRRILYGRRVTQSTPLPIF